MKLLFAFKVILMENLKKAGYELVDKRIGLDLTGIKMLLSQVSQLLISQSLKIQKQVFFLAFNAYAVSHHYLHTYPGGLDALFIDQPYFVNNHGWVKDESNEFGQKFEVIFQSK